MRWLCRADAEAASGIHPEQTASRRITCLRATAQTLAVGLGVVALGLALVGEKDELQLPQGLPGNEMGTIQCVSASRDALEDTNPVSQAHRQVFTDGRTAADKEGCLDADDTGTLGQWAPVVRGIGGVRLGPPLPVPSLVPEESGGRGAASGADDPGSLAGAQGPQESEAVDGTPTEVVAPETLRTVPDYAAVAGVVCAPRYTWDCGWAVATVFCESGGRADAYNPVGHWGWWQIDYEFEGWADPAVNTEKAWMKYLNAVAYWGDGRRPWPYCGYR